MADVTYTNNSPIFRQGIVTDSSKIESTTKNMLTNSYWLGGVDTRNKSLQSLDLARTGYGRLFITKMPRFVEKSLPGETKMFKHLLEFANIGIDGIAGYSVDFGSITAGYSGTTVEVPTVVKDDTQSITVKINETSDVLVQSYLDYWITGTIDPFTGLATYHGFIEDGVLDYGQANHTMEAVYIHTDPTGDNINYACLLTNMFPKSSDHSHWTSEPGSHELVSLSLEFTCNKYVTNQITAFGKKLLDNYKILKNYLNFNSGYTLNTSKNISLNGEEEQSQTPQSSNITAWNNGSTDLTDATPIKWS